MTIVALLPMKAHSERVSGKNFRELAGKPLFQWILDSLLQTNEIDRVVINTDARELLAEKGLTDSGRVTIRDRKPELCGDFVSMNLILEEDLRETEADHFIMTHTTNPLLSSDTINRALQKYLNGIKRDECDRLFIVKMVTLSITIQKISLELKTWSLGTKKTPASTFTQRHLS